MDLRCDKCDLHKTCRSVKIDPEGEGDIVFLGEAPGYDEDMLNRPFIGESGRLLRAMVEGIGLDLSRVRFTNAVRCRPPQNETPTLKQIRACVSNLAEEFINRPPKIIIPLGNIPLKSLREAELLNVQGTVMNLQGKPIDCKEYIIFPMLHPAYILRNPTSMEYYVEAFNSLDKLINEGMPKKKEVLYDFSNSAEDLNKIADSLEEIGLVAYDIETSVLHPAEGNARILSFSLTWEEGQAVAFHLNEQNREQILEILDTRILENEKIKKIIQHAKFELLWSMWRGRTIKNMADTMLMHWHVDEKNGTHGLGYLAMRYTDLGQYDSLLEEYKTNHKECDPGKSYKEKETGETRKGSYGNLPLEILLPYNCADTDAAFRIYKILLPQLNEKQLWLLDNIQIPACYPLAEMELRGVPIDWEYAGKLDQELPRQMEDIEKDILAFPEVQELNTDLEKEGKGSLNLNSTPMLSKLLFTYLKLPSVYQTKKGKPSTDKNVLSFLASKHPVPALIEKRRSIATIHSTFVAGAFKQKTGNNIHTSYGMAHTETGRYNSRGPNLQNIPRDALIKNMFVPDPGCLMVQIDYSQIELRVMALFSGDKNLLDYFRRGLDVHRMIASKIHKRDADTITKEERTKAKRTVFGLCYGQGPRGLAEELGIEEGEAFEFLEKFFKEFPAVRKWIEKTKASAEENGYVETMFGRIRRLPDARLSEQSLKSRAMRQAINMPIQGTAADILAYKKAALWRFLKESKFNSRMLLTVHDSLVLSVPLEEINLVIPHSKIIMEDMESFDWIKLPIVCDMEIGDRWGELVPIGESDIFKLAEGFDLKEILESKKSYKTL